MTSQFKKWFGRSKIIDANGKPLRVFKATAATDWDTGEPVHSIQRRTPFPTFDRNEPGGVNIIGFFTSSPEVADRFMLGYKGDHAVFPCYLRIEKPKIIDAKGESAGNIQFGQSGKPFRDAIRSGKYDGIIIKNTADEGDLYVPLVSPSQVKSAIGNKGMFSPDSPDLREARLIPYIRFFEDEVKVNPIDIKKTHYISLFKEAYELTMKGHKVIVNPTNASAISSLCNDTSMKIPRCRGLLINKKDIIAFESKDLVHDEMIKAINTKLAPKAPELQIQGDESNCYRTFFYLKENALIITPSTDEHKKLPDFGFLKKGTLKEIVVIPTADEAAEQGLL